MSIQITPDPEVYLEVVREYIGPNIGQFNYEALIYHYTDKSRFYSLAERLNKYHLIEGASIFSSGCGGGGGLVAYHDFGAKLVVGLEIDPLYIRMAAARTCQLNNAFVVHYSGGAVPFPDNTFDIIDSIQVIEHVPSPQFYLDELIRVLKPGGMFYLEFPNRLRLIEAHTNVPLIPILPKRVGDWLCKILSKLPGLSPQMRDKLTVIRTISEWYPTLLDMAWLLRHYPMEKRYLGTLNPKLQILNRMKVVLFLLPTKFGRVVLYKN